MMIIVIVRDVWPSVLSVILRPAKIALRLVGCAMKVFAQAVLMLATDVVVAPIATIVYQKTDIAARLFVKKASQMITKIGLMSRSAPCLLIFMC